MTDGGEGRGALAAHGAFFDKSKPLPERDLPGVVGLEDMSVCFALHPGVNRLIILLANHRTNYGPLFNKYRHRPS